MNDLITKKKTYYKILDRCCDVNWICGEFELKEGIIEWATDHRLAIKSIHMTEEDFNKLSEL